MVKSNRVWLNPEKGQVGCMAWSVEADWRTLTVRDCDRQVTLHFNGSKDAALKKVDLMVAELQKFKVAIEKIK